MRFIGLAALMLASPAMAGSVNKEPWPYYKAANVTGYQLYPLRGCNWYRIEELQVKQLCDPKAPGELFRNIDKDGHGVADAAAADGGSSK